jgi:choline dehydrogenase-like flavoprotein
MGSDPTSSVVDRYLVHHKVRNLLVLGASAFPTASPSYPTLTVAALSLWAADHQLGVATT